MSFHEKQYNIVNEIQLTSRLSLRGRWEIAAKDVQSQIKVRHESPDGASERAISVNGGTWHWH